MKLSELIKSLQNADKLFKKHGIDYDVTTIESISCEVRITDSGTVGQLVIKPTMKTRKLPSLGDNYFNPLNKNEP